MQPASPDANVLMAGVAPPLTPAFAQHLYNSRDNMRFASAENYFLIFSAWSICYIPCFRDFIAHRIFVTTYVATCVLGIHLPSGLCIQHPTYWVTVSTLGSGSSPSDSSAATEFIQLSPSIL